MTTIERVLQGGSAMEYIKSKGWSIKYNFNPETTIIYNDVLKTYCAHGHSSTSSLSKDECKAKCIILDENVGHLFNANYFQANGAQLHLIGKSLKPLEMGVFNGFSLTKHERLTDGTFVSSEFKSNNTFVYDGQIYMFLTYHSGVISGYFPLNMDRADESCGVYYELS